MTADIVDLAGFREPPPPSCPEQPDDLATTRKKMIAAFERNAMRFDHFECDLLKHIIMDMAGEPPDPSPRVEFTR